MTQKNRDVTLFVLIKGQTLKLPWLAIQTVATVYNNILWNFEQLKFVDAVKCLTAASPGFVNHSCKVVHTWVVKSWRLNHDLMNKRKVEKL